MRTGSSPYTCPLFSSVRVSRKNTTPMRMPMTVRLPAPLARIGPNTNGTASMQTSTTLSVRAMRDPALRARVKGFFGQEGRHAHAHDEFTQHLRDQGYELVGGRLLPDGPGKSAQLIPDAKMKEFKRPAPTLARVPGGESGHVALGFDHADCLAHGGVWLGVRGLFI